MRLSLLLALAASCLFTLPAVAADDDPDVAGKKASEWIDILRNNKEPNQRRRALLALQIAGPQVRKVFAFVGLTLKEDSEETVRKDAAHWLGEMMPRARDAELKEKIPITDGINALTDALKNDKVPAVREAVARALGKIGAEAAPAVTVLGAALKDANPGVRAAAAETLGHVGIEGKSALPELMQAVKESKGPEFVLARSYALLAIGRIGKPDSLKPDPITPEAVPAVPLLADVLADSDAPVDVRRRAAEVLGMFGKDASDAAEALGKALSDKEVQVRQAAVAALDRMGVEAKPGLPGIKKALADADKTVRCTAMHVVGQLGKELGSDVAEVVPRLLDNLKNTNSDVRLSAVGAFGMLGPEVLGDKLPRVRDDITLATRDPLGAIRDAATEVLKKLNK